MKLAAVYLTLLVLVGNYLVDADDPLFLTEPEDTRVHEGETVILQCVVSNLRRVHYVQWVKDGIAITFPNRTINVRRLRGDSLQVSEPTRYSIDGDYSHGEFNLRIVHTIKTEDEDTYRCIVFDDFGPVLFSTDIQLTVTSSDRYPVCLPSSTGIRSAYVEGDILRTECLYRNVEPSPQLAWLRNSRYVSAGQKLYPSLPDTVHEWRLTSEDDGAVITCEATGLALSTTETCTIGPLNVYYRPSATLVPEIVGISAGESVTFTCSVSANPTPTTYNWRINGSPVDLSTGKYSLSSNQRDLVISQVVELDDSMIVTCSVENVIGESSASAVLYVYAPVKPTSPTVTDGQTEPGRKTTVPKLPKSTQKTKTSVTTPGDDIVTTNSPQPRVAEGKGLALSIPVLAAVATGGLIFAIVIVVLICEFTRWNGKRRKAKREEVDRRVTGYYDVNLSTNGQTEDECKQKVNEWLRKSLEDKFYLVGSDRALSEKIDRTTSSQISRFSSRESVNRESDITKYNTTNEQHPRMDTLSSNDPDRHHYSEIADYPEIAETYTESTDSGVSGHVYSIPIDAKFTVGNYYPTVVSQGRLVNYGVIDPRQCVAK